MTSVERYGLYEAAYVATGEYDNPYLQAAAVADVSGPENRIWKMPLFWRGGDEWVLRLSPDAVGFWEYTVRSTDSGLKGCSGHFECLASPRHGGLEAMPGYPLHFQRQDGTPVWFMGDTNWRALATDAEMRLDRGTVLHYVDVRVAQGFNYVHVDVMGGGGVDSQQKVFEDWASERPRLAFFDEMDARVRYMTNRGVTCGLVLAWSRGCESWAAFPNDEARFRYARNIVARCAAYDVAFIVSGEWDLNGREPRALFARIGEAIARWDPHNRLRGIHAGRARVSSEFSSEAWTSFGDYQQNYRAPADREATAQERCSMRRRLLASRIYGKPVINAEYAYYMRSMPPDRTYRRDLLGQAVDKEHSHTRASFRRASWAIAMAGCYFVSGFGRTYFGGWRDRGPFDVDADKNDVAVADLQLIRDLFTSVAWWRLAVMDDLTSTDTGQAYCLADLDRAYIICAEGAQSVRVRLDGEPNTRYHARLCDPRSGECLPLADMVGLGPFQVALPDDRDWVIVVERAAADGEKRKRVQDSGREPDDSRTVLRSGFLKAKPS